VVIGGSGRAYAEAATLGTLMTLASHKKLGIQMWRVNDSRDMVYLAELLESEAITPAIDRTFALAEVPDAMRYLESGSTQGEVIISI
jgi:NADPH:quinone reductase-like Zn-dependent oxidoreductase